MAILSLFKWTLWFAAAVSACGGPASLVRRQGNGNATTRIEVSEQDWAYEASFNWGKINSGKSLVHSLLYASCLTAVAKEYELCQTGTQQSPIALRLDQGLSQNHVPHFDYPSESPGTIYNWGYGPAFALEHEDGVWDTLPSFTFEEEPGVNEIVYLRQWHIHAPADHTVQADRSKAELHLVHVDAEGHERAIVAIRIDPGVRTSPSFTQLPPLIGFNDTETQMSVDLDVSLPLSEVNFFNEFWTYRGSLTSPPCREGLRWYVARQILFVSTQQMQEILRVSTYSARAEQEVWLHQINV